MKAIYLCGCVLVTLTLMGCKKAPTALCPASASAWSSPQPAAGNNGCAGQPGTPVATGPAQQVTSANGLTIVQNITYAHRGGYDLQGDLYLPPVRDGGAPAGMLVVVHGGGWQDCSRRRAAVASFAQVWASALDVPTFNIEYRLDEEGGGYPNGLTDVKCAIQWATSQAPLSYPVDGSRIDVAGESAGANLALMVALTQNRADLDPGCGPLPAKVKGAAAFSSPNDLPLLSVNSQVGGAVESYTGPCDVAVGGSCGEARSCDRCVDASPLAHACGSAADLLLVQATDNYDPLIPPEESERLAGALGDAGIPVTFVEPTGAQLSAAGCSAGQAHGFVPCMTTVAAPDFAAWVHRTIGP